MNKIEVNGINKIDIDEVRFADTRKNRVGELRKDSFDIQFQTYSYFIVSSEFEKELIKSCYSVDKEILVTGSPRNDYFFQIKNNSLNEYTYLSKKVILYAPTWREYENNSSFFPFEDKDLNKLINKIQLYYK